MEQGFYFMHCPKGAESRYKLLVFDSKNEPFLPLTDFYQDCSGRISESSALSYLQCLLPFFYWLEKHSNYQGNHVMWNAPPEAVRIAIEGYLMNEMACKVRERDSFQIVNRTNKSPNTVNRFLSALKSFYKSLIRLKQYNYSNPLIDSQVILNEYKGSIEGARKDKPRMPSEAGTEAPIPHRRLTDSYFKLINEEWRPEIIDDPHLPYQVYQAGKKAHWSLRETVIARMLFETGARASEVIELTIGDYRSRNSFQEVKTFNKGSYGRRVKFLRFSKDTVKLLERYINQERKNFDSSQLKFDSLPNEAPMFLTEKGTPLTYEAWYYHWNKVIKRMNIKLNPHKARHWFVTTRMREIYNISKTEAEISQRKNELIKYMKWKQEDTIKVYEHYFDEEKHRDSHDQMLENMTDREKEYKEQQKNRRSKKTKLTLLETEKEMELDEDIQDLLDGLE
ncbi:tyrosine-type recombinase/integrase [Bacillus pacificus]|uniref:tyrosine-type recombinase/integrase n=1 Tax=Bacillus pacificus TaxID=2026187 RepID=UPI001D0DF4C8|nr:site-specific integrase [Bacillus pacificus]MCC2350586.1 site-specific integrase [Bacillus pacificus]MCC2469147.1 site-specific integrase [Bacillus pacificus]MCU5243995.1 site-specific integrase [Bacillus pacificus]MCU5416556.1 site-specific integrase [Bacillus pacificus]MCU5464833.1 site-specific integrase [Bacillus pacificus]